MIKVLGQTRNWVKMIYNSSCYSHAFRETRLTQKDNADSEVQFITPAGPRQSLLLAKDPVQHM